MPGKKGNTPPVQKEKPVSVDFEFRDHLNQTLSGIHHNYCYQCGACVSYCPAAQYHEDFNPRLLLLMAMMGLQEELLSSDSVIWKCTNCYTCYERCPQDVRPVEIIVALKNLAVERGTAPGVVSKFSDAILKTGASAPVTDAIQKKRQRMGLPEFHVRGLEELKKLFKDD